MDRASDPETGEYGAEQVGRFMYGPITTFIVALVALSGIRRRSIWRIRVPLIIQFVLTISALGLPLMAGILLLLSFLKPTREYCADANSPTTTNHQTEAPQ